MGALSSSGGEGRRSLIAPDNNDDAPRKMSPANHAILMMSLGTVSIRSGLQPRGAALSSQSSKLPWDDVWTMFGTTGEGIIYQEGSSLPILSCVSYFGNSAITRCTSMPASLRRDDTRYSSDLQLQQLLPIPQLQRLRLNMVMLYRPSKLHVHDCDNASQPFFLETKQKTYRGFRRHLPSRPSPSCT